jgi:2-oxoisovalerate dehydrogenase E1 component alpha subunit
MFGNENDPAKGRQMPDHYCFREAKVTSISSPIGTQITQAVGFAWAAKMRKEDLVALVYFGDGATSSNEFHNGANFAGVFKTPAILFCRNNGWAISVPTERQTASRGFAEKGVAYGIPGVSDDPKAYRPETALEPYKKLDPIGRVRRWLDANAGWTDAKDKEIEAELDAEVRAAVAVSEKTAGPALESLFEDVFAEPPWHLVEQRQALLDGPRAKKH